MENFSTPDMHRFFMLGKPSMHKKTTEILFRQATMTNNISNQTYRSTGYKKIKAL